MIRSVIPDPRTSTPPARPLCALLLALSIAAGCSGKSSEQHIATAEQYIAESQLEPATIELKNAIRKDPKSARARWLLGQNYLLTGDAESAAKELLRARELGWQRDDVLPALAKALLALGDYQGVSELPRDELSPDPRGELMAVQALSEFAQGDTERANALIRRALKQAPEVSDVQIAQARIRFAQKDYPGALAATGKVIAEHPDSGQAWSVSGDVYMRQGAFDDALKAYSKAITYQQYSPVEHLKRGLVRLQLKDYDGALADAKALLGYSPSNPGGNYIKGIVLFQREQYAAAQRPLSLAEPAWQQFPLVLFFLGSANLMQDNLEQAATYAGKFYETFPDNLAGRKLLATIRLKQEKFSEIETLLTPVLDKNPNDTDTLTLLANALLFDNRVDEGIALLETVAQLQPASASARIRLGTGLMLGGNSEAANEQLETALELDPQFQQAGILLILSHLQNREYPAAIDAAKSYQQRHPANAMSHNLLGRAYLENGQAKRARASFEKAIAVAPGDPSASHQLAKMAQAEGQPNEARRYYESVLEHHRNHLSTLIQLALLDAKDGNEQAVIAGMERAMTEHPTALEPRLLLGRYYLALGKPEHLPPLFATLNKSQRRSPRVMLLLALSQISDADNIGAQYTLEEMLRSTPETPETHHLLAMAAAGTGDGVQARASLRSALALNPHFLPSRLALARLDLGDGELTAFREHLDILVEVAPESVDVLQLRAAAAALDKKPDEALAFSQQVFSLAPSTQTLLELTRYLNFAGNNEVGSARLREWVVEHPADLPARLALGDQLRQTGQQEESLTHYEAVLDADAGNTRALSSLSRGLLQSNPKRSLALAEKASELAPDSAEMLDTLALAAYANEDYQEAALSIRRAIMKAPERPDYQYHQAMILSAQGETAGAIAVLEHVLAEEQAFAGYEEAVRLLDELKNPE
ncbi:MAG: PEP-CTERM system TPR-repeat protein PrsT [Halioglobus sp.]|nr:PEP-CTERM system TPR-repeat protein PrsT [Halioglobus sp.]